MLLYLSSEIHWEKLLFTYLVPGTCFGPINSGEKTVVIPQYTAVARIPCTVVLQLWRLGTTVSSGRSKGLLQMRRHACSYVSRNTSLPLEECQRLCFSIRWRS